MRDQQKICREEWFKEHEAYLLHKLDPIVIEWRKPKSWNYGCRFIIHSQWLCVVGDIGEAVYQWGQTIDLKFLSGLNFGYFMDKCQSSEVGRNFIQHDMQVASTKLKEWLSETDNRQCMSEHLLSDLAEVTHESCRDDYEQLVRQVYDETGDSELASMLSDFAVIPNCRCVGHFVGLKMAIEQLTKTS